MFMIYLLYYTFTALSNDDVLGFDMVDLLGAADNIPKRYYSAYKKNHLINNIS